MEVEEARRRWAAMARRHTAHRLCPSGCHSVLYKSATVGARVRKRDPYAFCRNPKCKLHGKDVSRVILVGDVLLDLRVLDDRRALAAVLEAMS